jgi:hypothetical protein
LLCGSIVVRLTMICLRCRWCWGLYLWKFLVWAFLVGAFLYIILLEFQIKLKIIPFSRYLLFCL